MGWERALLWLGAALAGGNLAITDAVAQMPSPPPPKTVFVPRPDPNDKSRPALPAGRPADWITLDDYPQDARRENRQGDVRFRLAVSNSGQPTACVISGSSGHLDLDYAACRLLLERARFRPALDRSGTPTTGYYGSRILWRIPPAAESYPRGPVPTGFLSFERPLATPLLGTEAAGSLSGQVRVSLRIAGDGSVARCAVVDGTAPEELVRESCPFVLKSAKFEPARNVDGKPTEGRYDVTLIWDDVAYMATMVPNPEQYFPPTGRLRQSFTVGKEGIISDCQAERSGVIPFDLMTANPCRMSFHGEPYRDDDGNPVERRVSIDFDVRVDPK